MRLEVDGEILFFFELYCRLFTVEGISKLVVFIVYLLSCVVVLIDKRIIDK